MKKKVAGLLTGALVTAMFLTGCSSNSASSDYVTVNGYKEVEVDDIEEPDEVTDEDVDQYIEAVLTQYGMTEQITDRAVESGDTVNIDFVGKMDGEAFDGGSSEAYNLEIGSGSFIEGFEDSIIGHMPGETFDWNGKFPDEYDNNPDLAGKDVTFTITVNYICGETTYPELTDELVQTLSEESKTVEEYREEIKKMLSENGNTDYDTQLQESAWDAVLEKTEIKEYPEGEVEKYTQELLDQYKQLAEEYGMEYGDFLQQYYGVSEEDFEEQAKSAAEENIKQRIVAEAIADKEKLTPKNDEEWQEEYEKLAEEYGYEDVDALKEAADEDTLKSIITINKVKEFLAENAIQVKE